MLYVTQLSPCYTILDTEPSPAYRKDMLAESFQGGFTRSVALLESRVDSLSNWSCPLSIAQLKAFTLSVESVVFEAQQMHRPHVEIH